MKIIYFAHNVGDPAIARRARMLCAGGAQVVVAGFRRGDQKPIDLPGVSVVTLGRTYDARLLQRLLHLFMALLRLPATLKHLASTDLILARNLEMVSLAVCARWLSRMRLPLVYECLDVHRLMSSDKFASKIMRAVERWAMRRCALMIVSSPAFIESYFKPRQKVFPPVLVVENRVVRLERESVSSSVDASDAAPRRAAPWRIGWFGMIRCRRSLAFLVDLARRRPDEVEVVIRGLPSYTEFDDFDATVSSSPNVTFKGRYTSAELAAIYADVDFVWAIDFFEENHNSEWLLPNRLYESLAHKVVPIALARAETGRWLARHKAGVVVDSLDSIESHLDGLSGEAYAELVACVRAVPERALVASQSDCLSLVDTLRNLLPLDAQGVLRKAR